MDEDPSTREAGKGVVAGDRDEPFEAEAPAHGRESGLESEPNSNSRPSEDDDETPDAAPEPKVDTEDPLFAALGLGIVRTGLGDSEVMELRASSGAPGRPAGVWLVYRDQMPELGQLVVDRAARNSSGERRVRRANGEWLEIRDRSVAWCRPLFHLKNRLDKKRRSVFLVLHT